MQGDKVIGQQIFVSEKIPEYVVFTHLYKFKEYIERAKENLAEGRSNKPTK